MFSLCGAVGQFSVHKYDEYRQKRPVESDSKQETVSWISQWSPMKRLTDEEYVAVMKGRIMEVEARIAELDEKLDGARADVERSGKKSNK